MEQSRAEKAKWGWKRNTTNVAFCQQYSLFVAQSDALKFLMRTIRDATGVAFCAAKCCIRENVIDFEGSGT